MVIGASVAGLDADDVDRGAGVLDGPLRLGELDLLAALGGEQDGDLEPVQRLAGHGVSLPSHVLGASPRPATQPACLKPPPRAEARRLPGESFAADGGEDLS